MNVSKHLTPLLLILTASCRTHPTQWQTLDFHAFKLQAPYGWTIVNQQGIDSYFGGLTNGKDSLWFDYGSYGVDLPDDDLYKYHVAKDTVNGFSSMVTVPDSVGKGYVSMFIPKVTDTTKFSMWGKNIPETETVLRIYKSIVFKNSDTSNNPPLTNSKFMYNIHGSGKTLFYSNCASCHSLNRRLEGPSLQELTRRRTADWLYKFFTNRKLVAGGKFHQALKEVFNNTECREFPDLTKEDVELLLYYIQAN